MLFFLAARFLNIEKFLVMNYSSTMNSSIQSKVLYTTFREIRTVSILFLIQLDLENIFDISYRQNNKITTLTYNLLTFEIAIGILGG